MRLVERSPHHVALSSIGEEFLPHAQQVFSELDAAIATTSAQRFLRLGFSWLLPDPWVQHTIAAFKQTTGATSPWCAVTTL